MIWRPNCSGRANAKVFKKYSQIKLQMKREALCHSPGMELLWKVLLAGSLGVTSMNALFSPTDIPSRLRKLGRAYS
jgi:hypothetical protein